MKEVFVADAFRKVELRTVDLPEKVVIALLREEDEEGEEEEQRIEKRA